MVQTRTPADTEIALDTVDRLITEDGSRLPSPDLDRWVADVGPESMRSMLREMTVLRAIDTEGVRLQRQGELGLWPPCEGQEAAQVGTATALRADDYVFPSYRETGVLLVRGAEPADYVRAWRGEENSGYDAERLRTAPLQVIIGAQTLHAVGYAMGVQRDGADQVAVTYFGDGATSQGDVSEAMVFAASFAAPVVFVCQNNQWAISEPVAVQSRQPIASRAVGFGIRSRRVDGNDALACLAAMRWALDHARKGGGPAFVEAVTYRMGPHTTADDPTRYRTAEEVQAWRRRDPIARLDAHLRSLGELDDTSAAELAAEADRAAAQLREACMALSSREPVAVFDGVYAEPHSELERERRHFAAYVDGLAPQEPAR